MDTQKIIKKIRNIAIFTIIDFGIYSAFTIFTQLNSFITIPISALIAYILMSE